MRNTFFRGALAALLAVGAGVVLAPSAEARRPKSAKLRAMTFNIRFDFPNDGKNGWKHRVDLVVETIKNSQAQLVCLQEDKAAQIEDLKKRMPEWEFIGRGRNATGSGERCSIAFQKKRFKLKDSGSFWLSDTPDKPGSNTWGDKYPRVVTWAFLTTRKGKKSFLVLNTHFVEGKNDRLRLKGSELIASWIRQKTVTKKRGKTKMLPVILTGDFNSDGGSPVHDVFTAASPDGGAALMRDAWEEAPPARARHPGTYNGFVGRKTNNRIDWVLVGGTARAFQSGKIEDDFDGRYPSDHYPVFADIEVY